MGSAAERLRGRRLSTFVAISSLFAAFGSARRTPEYRLRIAASFVDGISPLSDGLASGAPLLLEVRPGRGAR